MLGEEEMGIDEKKMRVKEIEGGMKGGLD